MRRIICLCETAFLVIHIHSFFDGEFLAMALGIGVRNT